MTWDLATARQAAGYAPGDTSHDTALQVVMSTTLAEIEAKLGRGLLYKREQHTFYDVDTRRFRLPRWPVAIVHSPKCRIVHHRVGWIEPQAPFTLQNNSLVVDYEGGFNPLPDDLEYVLWAAFKVKWGDADPATGLPASGSVAAGGVSRVSLADFGAVSFDVGGSASADVGAGASDTEDFGWLAPWASILRLYVSDESYFSAIA